MRLCRGLNSGREKRPAGRLCSACGSSWWSNRYRGLSPANRYNPKDDTRSHLQQPRCTTREEQSKSLHPRGNPWRRRGVCCHQPSCAGRRIARWRRGGRGIERDCPVAAWMDRCRCSHRVDPPRETYRPTHREIHLVRDRTSPESRCRIPWRLLLQRRRRSCQTLVPMLVE